jgi:hypothetical protein
VNGQEVKELPLETETTLETVALLTRKKDVEKIDIEMTVDYEAPNKVEVPKREYPGCPEEKVKTIEEALKYFGLIK